MRQKLRPAMCLLAGSAIMLGAAGKPPTAASLPVQIADTGPLAATYAAPAAPVQKMPDQLTASQAMFEAAPVPNRTLDAPDSAGSAPTTQLAPALLSEKAAFAGDGFSGGSSQEQATTDRQHPAAGLSLSVPVK